MLVSVSIHPPPAVCARAHVKSCGCVVDEPSATRLLRRPASSDEKDLCPVDGVCRACRGSPRSVSTERRGVVVIAVLTRGDITRPQAVLSWPNETMRFALGSVCCSRLGSDIASRLL